MMLWFRQPAEEDLVRAITCADIDQLVGEELGVSEWLVVDQDRVNRFADATDDHQWIHVDQTRAGSELGGTIAHGFLILSLIPALRDQVYEVTDMVRELNYGLDQVRFVRPVPVGRRIRLKLTLNNAARRPDGGVLLTLGCVLELEGDAKPACVADFRVVAYGPAA